VKYRIKPEKKFGVTDRCKGCFRCTQIGCLAIRRVEDKRESVRRVEINQELCAGCGLCSRVCPSEAIE
jgi:indolepyruvate ferredoxin oxidoreductase alpha subunit